MSRKFLLLLLPFLLCSNAYSSVSLPSHIVKKAFQVDKKYTLSIACIFKNEADYLKEWIEYHRIVGVEHFYLFDNQSDDKSKEVLKPYIESGIVTLIDWNDGYREGDLQKPYAWVGSTQIPALEYACNNFAKHESIWIAFIDTDEFLVPIQSSTIVDVLKKYDDKAGVVIRWRVYGTSNVNKISENQLMIEALIKCTTPADALCNVTKTICKTEKFLKFGSYGPHHCCYIDGSAHFIIPTNEIVINHYMNRNEDHFYSHKIKNKEKILKKKFTHAEIIEEANIGNAMVDDEKYIFRFVSELREKMGYDKTPTLRPVCSCPEVGSGGSF